MTGDCELGGMPSSIAQISDTNSSSENMRDSSARSARTASSRLTYRSAEGEVADARIRLLVTPLRCGSASGAA